MRTIEGNKIYAIVRAHIGAGNAISAPEICHQLRWRPSQERSVRRIIADECHVWPDILVCSIPGKGYFCAQSYEEAEQRDNWLSGLLESARNKQTTFRVACQKMGFNFTKTNQKRQDLQDSSGLQNGSRQNRANPVSKLQEAAK